MAGACLLFETTPDASAELARHLATEFQIGLEPAAKLGNPREWAGEYIEYRQPVRRLVRPFLSSVTVLHAQGAVLAQSNQTTVAVEKPMGRGRIIFLGSMLGPGLFAEEREAHEVAAALLS